jgi:hypothetical protein
MLLAASMPANQALAASDAETACLDAVERQYRDQNTWLQIVDSEYSYPNVVVIIDTEEERWRCVASTDGLKVELSRTQNGSAYGRWAGQSQPANQRQGVTLYRDNNYRGASELFYEDTPRMKGTRIGNDALSSIRVPHGCKVILYEDIEYRGRSIELYGDEPELGRTQIGNDQVSSLRVDCGGYGQQGVTLFRDINFRGTSQTFYEDTPKMKGTQIGNDELSSIRVPAGCRVTLYQDIEFRGKSLELFKDEPNLGSTRIGNDEVSSFRVDCQ